MLRSIRFIHYFFLWVFLIAVLIFFLYHRIVHAYFVSDEYAFWKYTRNLNFFESLRVFLPPELGGIAKEVYYRPVLDWTIWFDTVVFPMTPVSFHLTSLMFHLINTLLIGILALYSFGRKHYALLASCLFAVFPFHSEAVIYSIGGRDNVIATMFYFLSFLQVIQYSATRKNIYIVTLCITFLFALMSHESAVTLPLSIFLFLLIYQRVRLGIIYRRYRFLLMSLFLVFVFYFILRSIVLQAVNPYAHTGYMNGSFTLNNVFKLYCVIFILLLAMRFLAKGVFRIFVTKEHIFWFYVILTGTLLLPTFYIPTQERHLYLPSFAFVLALCSVIFSLGAVVSKKKLWMKKMLWICVVCVFMLSGYVLMQRNERWRRATIVAENISKEIATVIRKHESARKFYFINFPDSIDGVYVYRVRMKEALEFALGEDMTQELIVTPLIFGITSDVHVMNKHSILVQSDNGFLLFLPQRNSGGKSIIASNKYLATQLDAKTLRIDFLENGFDIGKNNIFLFQDGRAVYKPFANMVKVTTSKK